jgi:hypothetical protein
MHRDGENRTPVLKPMVITSVIELSSVVKKK